MDERRSGAAWVKWGRRGVALVVGVVLLGFFGSNLLMRTGWFRGKVEGRLTQHTRLMWTVDEMSWSPWGGVRAAGMKAVAYGPEAARIPPVVQIAEVRVRPYWKELLRGRARVREVLVTEPQGQMPLELLVQLMRADGRVGVARMGAVAGGADTPRDPVPAADEESGETETAGAEESATEEGAASPAEKPPQPTPPQPTPPPVAPEPEVEPTGRLIVQGGEMAFYSVAAPGKSLQVTGLEMDVPFSGAEAGGMLRASGVMVAGEKWSEALEVPIRWKQGTIECPAQEYDWNGMKIQTAGAVRIRGRLLGMVEVRVVSPRTEPQSVPGWEAMHFATGPLELRARWTGDMIRPVTWQGNLVAGVQGVQFVHRGSGESVLFDQARLVTDLRGGVLQILDGTLAGERLSLFGNGMVLVDGRAYGVGRVVAAPEVAESITRVAAGAMVSLGYVHDWMAPLGTPDRYYRDIYLQGQAPNFEFDLGPNREWTDSEWAFKLMRMFVIREERELQQVEAPEGGES